MRLIALYPNPSGIPAAVVYWANDIASGSLPDPVATAAAVKALPADGRYLTVRMDTCPELTDMDADEAVLAGNIPATGGPTEKVMASLAANLRVQGVGSLRGTWFNNEQGMVALGDALVRAINGPDKWRLPIDIQFVVPSILTDWNNPARPAMQQTCAAYCYGILNRFFQDAFDPLAAMGPAMNSPGGLMAGYQAWRSPDTYGNDLASIPGITFDAAPVCSFKADGYPAYHVQQSWLGYLRQLDAVASQGVKLHVWPVLTVPGMPNFGPIVSEAALTDNFQHMYARGVDAFFIFNVPTSNVPYDISQFAMAFAKAQFRRDTSAITPIDYYASQSVKSGPFTTTYEQWMAMNGSS